MIDNKRNIKAFPQKDIYRLYQYLKKRKQESCGKGLSILFDLTYACNLQCLGCGVNATFIEDSHALLKRELKTDKVVQILERIAEHAYQSNSEPPRVCFGGGEPLLRKDLPYILKSAHSLFGRHNLSIDTNAYFLSAKTLDLIGQYVGKIEFGCEGIEYNHNYWRNPKNRKLSKEPYDVLLDAVNRSLNWNGRELNVELLFLPTRQNLQDYSAVLRTWERIGVKDFSIHRCMPTGRMALCPELIPDLTDYFWLLKQSLLLQKELNVNIHIHHSIENALSKFFWGENMPSFNRTLCPNWRATITIDAFGNVHFCPWSVSKPLSSLHLGSAIDYDFKSILSKHSQCDENETLQKISGCAIPVLLFSKTNHLSRKAIKNAAECDPLIKSLYAQT